MIFICLPISFSDIFVIVFPYFSIILRLAVCITTSVLTCEWYECVIPDIFLKALTWNASSLSYSAFVKLADSRPYNSLLVITASCTHYTHNNIVTNNNNNNDNNNKTNDNNNY